MKETEFTGYIERIMKLFPGKFQPEHFVELWKSVGEFCTPTIMDLAIGRRLESTFPTGYPELLQEVKELMLSDARITVKNKSSCVLCEGTALISSKDKNALDFVFRCPCGCKDLVGSEGTRVKFSPRIPDWNDDYRKHGFSLVFENYKKFGWENPWPRTLTK